MNDIENIMELGPMTTTRLLEPFLDNAEVIDRFSSVIPLSDKPCMDKEIGRVVGYLVSLGKPKLFLLSPEISVLEQLCVHRDKITEVIIGLSSDMDSETFERIQNNMPAALNTTILREPLFPADFRPDNGVIVSFGYAKGGDGLILKQNYRMLELYKSFYGRNVLVSCLQDKQMERPYNWMPLNTYEYFTDVV